VPGGFECNGVQRWPDISKAMKTKEENGRLSSRFRESCGLRNSCEPQFWVGIV
jgi:hypothetical protein